MADEGPIQAVNVAVGKLIKMARVSRGWNQARLGAEVGADQSTVSEWERGMSWPQKLDDVMRILEISPDAFKAATEEGLGVEDDVEKAIRQNRALSADARQALLVIYRKILAAELLIRKRV